MPALTGVVKSLKKDKGFGFIRGDRGKTEYFFHADDLHGLRFDDLVEGDKVMFDVTEEEKGPRARKITELSEAGYEAGSSDLRSK